MEMNFWNRNLLLTIFANPILSLSQKPQQTFDDRRNSPKIEDFTVLVNAS